MKNKVLKNALPEVLVPENRDIEKILFYYISVGTVPSEKAIELVEKHRTAHLNLINKLAKQGIVVEFYPVQESGLARVELLDLGDVRYNDIDDANELCSAEVTEPALLVSNNQFTISDADLPNNIVVETIAD